MVDTSSEATIERIVLIRIAKLLEVMLVIESCHPELLDALRASLPNSLHRSILLSAHHVEGIHFRAQHHELDDRIGARSIFAIPQHCFLRSEFLLVVGIGGLEVGELEVLLHLDHVFVEIRRLDIVHEGVCVDEE